MSQSTPTPCLFYSPPASRLVQVPLVGSSCAYIRRLLHSSQVLTRPALALRPCGPRGERMRSRAARPSAFSSRAAALVCRRPTGRPGDGPQTTRAVLPAVLATGGHKQHKRRDHHLHKQGSKGRLGCCMYAHASSVVPNRPGSV